MAMARARARAETKLLEFSFCSTRLKRLSAVSCQLVESVSDEAGR